LTECARGQTEAGAWILPTLRDRLEDALSTEDYRVERVDATYSTQRCHVCEGLADVGQATISCETENCPVDAVCRDRSAAATLARRARRRHGGRELDVAGAAGTEGNSSN
jgi:transposase